MKAKKILVSQPDPNNEKSPYNALALSHSLEIDFKPFIAIKPLAVNEFRESKIFVPDHTAVILTSRHATDHFFRIYDELRLEKNPNLKYFCITELISNYLQKYIVIKKRKVFVGGRTCSDLFPLFSKHHTEKYLYPTSQNPQQEIIDYLRSNTIDFTVAQMYRIAPNDMKDVNPANYDMLVFFSPAEINALLENFPDYQQGATLFACYGNSTAKSIREAGFRVDVEAPMPDFPSMTGTLGHFFNSK